MSNTLATVILTLIGGGFFLAFARMLKGPKGPDRAVALDTATLISTNLLVLIALFEDRSMLVDVAVVYSVLSFLGVLSIARYLDGGLR